MSKDTRGSFEVAKDAFGSIQASLTHARGNSTMADADRKRLRIGSTCARLAARNSAALVI